MVPAVEQTMYLAGKFKEHVFVVFVYLKLSSLANPNRESVKTQK
jgi:hypothetical protein